MIVIIIMPSSFLRTLSEALLSSSHAAAAVHAKMSFLARRCTFLSGQQDPSGGRGRRGGRGSNIIETVHHQWGREHKKSLGRKAEGGGSLVRQCVTSVQRQWKEILDGWGNKWLSKRLRYLCKRLSHGISPSGPDALACGLLHVSSSRG